MCELYIESKVSAIDKSGNNKIIQWIEIVTLVDSDSILVA